MPRYTTDFPLLIMITLFPAKSDFEDTGEGTSERLSAFTASCFVTEWRV